jgi:hypothetical protein
MLAFASATSAVNAGSSAGSLAAEAGGALGASFERLFEQAERSNTARESRTSRSRTMDDPMYVGRKHTSTVTLKTVLPFRCASCAHEAQALVVGVGQGQGNSPYFLDESGAKERAASSADSAARENATLTLKLAACPKCGARDEAAVRAIKLKAVAGVVACLVLLPLLGVFIDSLRRTSFGFWIFVVCGVFAAWGVWRSQSWKWTTIDHRVAFLPKG